MHAKRRETGEISRQQILDAASRLIASQGYDKTSMSQLCKAVGLPASSIYWHFGNKEGVLAAVMERGAQGFFGQFPENVKFSGTPKERLQQMLQQTGTALITDSRHAQFLQILIRFRMNEESHRGADFYEVASRVRMQGIEFMHRWLTEAYTDQYGGQISEHIANELSEFGVALIDGVFLTYKSGGPASLEKLLNMTANSLVHLAEDLIDNFDSTGPSEESSKP